MEKTADKGKVQVGKLHPILADQHLGTRIRKCAGETLEGGKNTTKELGEVQAIPTKVILIQQIGQNWEYSP